MASCLHAHATKPTTNVNGCFPSVSLILLIHVLLGLLFCCPKCWPPHRMQTHPRAAVLRHDSIGVCSVRAAKAKNLANRLTAYQRGYLVFLIILATHQLSMLINGTAARLTTSYKRMDGLPHRFASFSEKVFLFFLRFLKRRTMAVSSTTNPHKTVSFLLCWDRYGDLPTVDDWIITA